MVQPIKLIFGSTAIKHWFPDYPNEPKDLDYLVSGMPDMDMKRPLIEYHHPKNGAFAPLLKYNKDIWYVDPDLLYTIKCSHVAWEGKNGKWWKHIKDIVFLKSKGCKLNREVFDAFYKNWQQEFNDKSNISLNVAVQKFFEDGVRREYDHDWLHEYFKIGDAPAYSRALTKDGSPLMSLYLFTKLTEEQRLHCALEEMFVVSFERKVPLSIAYKQLITTMTKGWFNLFMIQNTVELLDGFLEEKDAYKIKCKNIRSDYEQGKIKKSR